jgi:hypothetical protein
MSRDIKWIIIWLYINKAKDKQVAAIISTLNPEPSIA